MKDHIAMFAKAAPFVPFEIELVSGRVLSINHPEFVFVFPGRSPHFIVVDDKDVGEYLNANLVLAVRPLAAARKQPRRKRAG